MKNLSKILFLLIVILGLTFIIFLEVNAQSKYVVRLGHFQATTHPVGIATDDFAKNVKERSNGQLEIQVFPAAQMGDTTDLMQALEIGTIDMVWTDSSHYGDYMPEWHGMNGGFLFRDKEHMHNVWNGPVGDELKEELLKRAEMRILTFHYNGERHITTSNKPIYHPEDLKGVRLRVPGVEPFVRTFEALGVPGVSVAYNETYMALQTGLVEGQENPFSSIYAMKFHEVQNYLILTGHMLQTGTYTIKESAWKKLPENLQIILLEEAEKAGKLCESIYSKEENDLVPILKEYMTFIEIDKSEFQKAALEGGLLEYFNSKLGADLFQKIMETK